STRQTIHLIKCLYLMKSFIAIITTAVFALAACAQNDGKINTKHMIDVSVEGKSLEIATFGAGCFWCVEAVFQQLKGVEKVESGYSGGTVKNPGYREVTGGKTGHAEVVQIHFDPAVISFETLLEVFWSTHDPTTLNRQGNDVGTQYRSAVFYHDEAQKEAAIRVKKEVAEPLWDDPIVTEISPYTGYY